MNKIDGQSEATFAYIVGLIGFILAAVGFILTFSGAAEMQGAEAEGVLFMAFLLCTGLAFVGLMISTLAQLLKSMQKIEKLLMAQNEMLEKGTSKAKAPARKSTAKGKAKKS